MSTLAPDSVRPETPLERLLGGRTASTLAKELNLTTAEELLRHFPRRYVAYGQLSAFVDLAARADRENLDRLEALIAKRRGGDDP